MKKKEKKIVSSTVNKNIFKNFKNDIEKKDITMIVYKIVSIFLMTLCLIFLGLFSYNLIKLNLLPLRFLVVGYSIILLLFVIMAYVIFKKRSVILKTVFLIAITASSGGLLYINNYLSSTNDFLAQVGERISNLAYSVIVLNDSPFDNIDQLEYTNIGFIDNEELRDIRDNLPFSYNETLETELPELTNSLSEKRLDAIVLENGYYTLALEEIVNFKEDTKVIYTFEIKKEESITSTKDKTITSDPFVLYISGIDQYGNISSIRGRSDVNQLLVVNPKTNHVLIVNTPRDYYVQLHGTSGLKDKLTHAGIYGIDKSITTLEDLYDIDIDHYLRVNFNTVVKVVDLIGGIDVNSDVNFYYPSMTKPIVKGMNHLNGKEALIYSRERHAYTSGDNHRGQNQQQVITAIIEKMTKSDALIKNYNNILKALNGSFQTDLSSKDIASLIRHQLDEMPSWKIESTAVTGYGSSNYTYSMGSNYLLYVMEPNMQSVNAVKERIKEVLNEN